VSHFYIPPCLNIVYHFCHDHGAPTQRPNHMKVATHNEFDWNAAFHALLLAAIIICRQELWNKSSNVLEVAEFRNKINCIKIYSNNAARLFVCLRRWLNCCDFMSQLPAKSLLNGLKYLSHIPELFSIWFNRSPIKSFSNLAAREIRQTTFKHLFGISNTIFGRDKGCLIAQCFCC
jgi:hypothetical protein